MNIRGRLVCYKSDSSIKWISNIKNTIPCTTLSLADFNQDGVPEVFTNNKIFNAQNGILLADGGNSIFQSYSSSNSIAVNLDEDLEDLELVFGYSVYKVYIQNLNDTIGNRMIENKLTTTNANSTNTIIGIADINQDSILDIIILGGNLINKNLFVYSYINGNYQKISETNWLKWGDYGNNLSIGKTNKIDEVGILISGVDHVRKFSIDNTGILRENWIHNVKDISGLIGYVLFDFDNDGIEEIVYRDEKNLVILSAKNNLPIIVANSPCVSSTTDEYPIIGDIDGTGETKICVVCSISYNDFFGKLTVFGAPAGQKWAPARNIWHQYAYNPLFINDDGTVPQHMHNPATYKNGKYNNFMAQESRIDENGNYPVPAASLTGDITCINYDIVSGQYSVDFGVYNRHDASATANGGVAISFYSGNPENGGKLIGVYHTTKDIRPDSTLNDRFSFTGSDLTTLWMIVNTNRYPIIVSDTSYYGIDECDYTDNVYIVQLPQVTIVNKEICGGDSYDFYGDALTQAGQYTHETKNISGCDSIITVLTLAVTGIKTADETRTSCEPYVWNGQTYTSSGSYTYQTSSVNGCDSITTLHLTIHQPDLISETKAHCGSYVWNGQTYTTSGRYTYQTLNIHGCNSTVTLDLKLYPQYQDTIIKGACDSYLWNGMSYTNSGTYTYTGQTIHGCDSVVTLQLTISQPDNINTSHTACDSYTWNNQTYTQTGDYTHHTQNIYGCDSTTTLQLAIHPSAAQSIALTECDSLSYLGQTLRTSGIYKFNLQTRYGCDSIVSLNLTISGDKLNDTQSACGNYIWLVNNKTYDQSGIYIEKYQNISGCDSTIALNLTIYPIYTEQKAAEACAHYEWEATKQRYTQSGIYTTTLRTTQGCDSTITLNLTVHPEYEYHDTIVTDAPYWWTVSNENYDQSGIYSKAYVSEYACDSIRYLHLTIRYQTDIYFPNVLTPDSRNGYFTGYSTGHATTIESLSVYDRWGNLMYQKKHFPTNEPESGWNGTYKGQPVIPAVYVWIAKTRLKDGSEVTYTGDVTVVR